MRPTLASMLAGSLAVCLSLLAASPAAAANETRPIENKVLSALASQVLLPMAGDFTQASAALADQSRAYCRDQAKLEDVRAAWRRTQSAWQALEMMPIGPLSENRLHRHINAWPLRLPLLEPLLKDDKNVDVDRVNRMGAAGKGLPAVEYLLFDANDKLRHSYCGSLTALTAHISGQAQSLERAWKEPDGGFGGQLANAGLPGYTDIFASSDQAISDIVNLLIAGLDSVKTRKLGKALERSTDTPALERIESWRSGTSLDHIADNLRGFEEVFFGKGPNGLGLDDYLTSLERPGLVRVIAKQLNATRQALANVSPPLQTALVKQRDALAALHKEISRLQYLMETEVATALNVDLGFNANDGD